MTRQVEALGRGLVAVPTDGGVLVRWRLLGTDPDDIGFAVSRNGTTITDDPITGSTNHFDPAGSAGDTYRVTPVVDSDEATLSDGGVADGKGSSNPVGAWDHPYKDIPITKPEPIEHEDRDRTVYAANDASVGDLTGDGTYDIVLKWSPSDAKDNAHEGTTSDALLDGYTMDGDHLWRINLGRNIRAGSHYTPFLVYDFDGDGTAEVAVRTADGTVDGEGSTIGDPEADYVDENGRILEGPEFLSVFDGATGEQLETVDLSPARGDVSDWGDSHGNRADRFLAGVAYLDGERPSIVWGRGYYEKTMVAAFDYRDDELSRRWLFDSTEGNEEYEGQGNHSLSVADVDDDGRDEIVYGACVIDHDGTGLYSTGWGHGDALHVGDFDPGRDGLEVFQIHEPSDAEYGASMREAGTGELIWGEHTGTDTGRGMAADIDPRYDGVEMWALAGVGLWSANGERISEDIPHAVNFGIWWTGDRQRELLDHDIGDDPRTAVGTIDRWNWTEQTLERLDRFDGTYSNNWTKGTPCLSGDLLGDWREEVIYRTEDSTALRLYATTHETDHRIPTLMHDTMYRCAIAWQNAGYNQPPHPSFFIGAGMDDPPDYDVDPV